jgi:hypothetical protein
MSKAVISKYLRHIAFPALLVLGSVSQVSCYARSDDPIDSTQTFRVRVKKVNGIAPPSAEKPLPPNIGTTDEEWEVEIEAVGPDGGIATDFDGFVRLSVEPGAVVEVVNAGDGENLGKNLRLAAGKGNAAVKVTAVYGPARLWVEDLGYVKAPDGKTPACANGKNDDPDDDVLVDFPNDPGCAFADDDSEIAGTFAAGVSAAVAYELPSVQDIQGNGSTTPFPYESMTVNTGGEHFLVVTRISKDGFYVTDLSGQSVGFNHMFAFNFSTPRGMRVCDRVTYLSGTVSEFFGFTEMNFPSFDVDPLFEGDEAGCPVPEPPVLEAAVISAPLEMERLESGLVRIEGYHVSQNMGPALALNNVFKEGQTNCDFNGDGKIDFASDAEGTCGNACSDDDECTEWTGYISRGNYKVAKTTTDDMGNSVSSVIQIQTDGAPEFNPVANRGLELTAVTGTLRNFSGGSLNWTVEARCPDDVVCSELGCVDEVLGSKEACVSLRTEDDNDEGSN